MSEDCGCCAGPVGLEDFVRQNRPGLPEIDYRMGTFATFRQSILNDLSRTSELSGLRSRISDDYSISTVDMWSAVADIVAFYSERIANEGFIRTATSRESVLRLARLLDYQLAPGLAARTLLAFTLESGATATIPSRTRVQSTPAEGEKPQKYETLEPLDADWRLNRLRLYPAPIPKNPFEVGSRSARAAADPPATAAVAALAKGDQVMVYSPTAVEILTVDDTTVHGDLVTVTWKKPLYAAALSDAVTGTSYRSRAYRLGRSFRLFGVDAPTQITTVKPIPDGKNWTVVHEILWTDFTLSDGEKNGTAVCLDARYDNLTAGQTVLAVTQVAGKTTVAPFGIASAKPNAVQRKAGSTVVANGTVTELGLTQLGDIAFSTLDPGDIRLVTLYELVGEPLRFWPYDYPPQLTSDTVYLPGARVGWSTLEIGRSIEKGKYTPGITLAPSDFTIGKKVYVTDDTGTAPMVTTIAAAALTGSDVTITADDPSVAAALGLAAATPATTLVSATLPTEVSLPRARPELAVTIGTLSAQTVILDLASGTTPLTTIAAELQQAIRAAMVSEEGFALSTVWVDDTGTDTATILVGTGVPDTPIRFGHTDNDEVSAATLGLDGAHVRFADGILSGAPSGLAVNGTARVALGTAPASTKTITLAAGTAEQWAPQLRDQLGLAVVATADDRLLFMPRLARPAGPQWLRVTLSALPTAFDSDTAQLLGNVIDASHGETVRDEIVGDGDASAMFQQFALSKKPVTVLSAPTASGIESSLQLFVNQEKWTEVESLYNAAATDHIYITRTADDGTTTIEFGDGRHGARPPTGRQNIVATYRQGSGVTGAVRSNTLRTPLDRPTGLKAVANPLPGEGASDGESLENARSAAPGSVRTFGRAVSLLDFEDATLTHRQVAKASAQWVWAGDRRVVHVTVAGADGGTFSDVALARIAARLRAIRDPNRPLLLGNYIPVAVTISGSVIVEPNRIAQTVLDSAKEALKQSFSFQRRGFAQPIYLSDIYAVLQHIDGVAGVDIDTLDLKTRDDAVRQEHGIDSTATGTQPRVLILPARWSAVRGAVVPAELAVIEVPALDVTLSATGGVAQ